MFFGNKNSNDNLDVQKLEEVLEKLNNGNFDFNVDLGFWL